MLSNRLRVAIQSPRGFLVIPKRGALRLTEASAEAGLCNLSEPVQVGTLNLSVCAKKGRHAKTRFLQPRCSGATNFSSSLPAIQKHSSATQEVTRLYTK